MYRRVSIAVIAVFFALGLRGTSLAKVSVDPAIMTQITAAANAVTTGNSAALQNAFTADAVIVDEFPPFRWSGSGAGVSWIKDFGAVAKQMKLSAPRATPHPARYYEHDAKRAYVVVPTDFKYVMAGKTATETGAWTFVFVKVGGAWKISAMTWAKTSG